MTELAGDLEGIGPVAADQIAQRYSRQRRAFTGGGASTGRLTFDEGQVYGAKFGTEEGMAALEAIALTLGPGRFSFTSASPEPELRNLNSTVKR